jgi:hypothetical protein
VIVSSPKSAAGNTLETLRPSAGSRRKAPPDFYTLLLVIALVAILITVLFLWLYVKDADYKTKTPPIAMVVGWPWAGAVGWLARKRKK